MSFLLDGKKPTVGIRLTAKQPLRKHKCGRDIMIRKNYRWCPYCHCVVMKGRDRKPPVPKVRTPKKQLVLTRDGNTKAVEPPVRKPNNWQLAVDRLWAEHIGQTV